LAAFLFGGIEMPEPKENETQKEFVARCIPIVLDDGTAESQNQAIAVCFSMWEQAQKAPVKMAEHNALKAIARTDDTLTVGNYIVLFGGRDLEGLGSDAKNADGTIGEYFTKSTQLDSPYTDTGHLLIDWEHGQGKAVDGAIGPGPDDIFGLVDWKSAQIDDLGVWVQRVLNRRSKYVKWLEQLIDEGLIGSSSEAIPDQVEKKKNGEIVRWPLRRDTFTVSPMEPRMLKENVIRAAKALGLQIEDTGEQPEPEAQPEAGAEQQPQAVEAATVEAVQNQLELELFLLEV
jgi:hypothetical protein